MAIKKFLIHDKAIIYQSIESDSGHEFSILDGHAQAKKVKTSNVHYDQQAGTLFFEVDGKPFKAYVATSSDQQGKTAWHVNFAHKKNSITVQEPQDDTHAVASERSSRNSTASDNIPGEKKLKSPLAGRVSKILIKPAQLVTKGQPLLLIESMKMDKEICASSNFFIKTILIAEGNVVQQNQILIDFEGEGEADATAKNANEQKAVQDR